MIPSGTLAPDVPDELFVGPPGTALRIERPDPRIADFVSDYYVFDSEGAEVMGRVEYSIPGSANFRFYLGERQINVTIGTRHFAPAPRAALYGPTSRAPRLETFGGVTIGMGITPLGWARLVDKPAEQFRDSIVPLDRILPGDMAARLHAMLDRSDQALEVKGLLDAFFLEHIGQPHPDEALIRQLMALIGDERVAELTEMAVEVGLTPQQLRQISLRHFGFPPKRLLRRARFLRSLLRMYAAGEADYSLRSHSYFDVSHFLRDSEEFLGMTPRRFMAQQTPYLRHILKTRSAVFGAPAQALYPISAQA